jgi:hypothetical protein
VGGGRWEVGGGRWEVGGGRWEVGGGRWEGEEAYRILIVDDLALNRTGASVPLIAFLSTALSKVSRAL